MRKVVQGKHNELVSVDPTVRLCPYIVTKLIKHGFTEVNNRSFTL